MCDDHPAHRAQNFALLLGNSTDFEGCNIHDDDDDDDDDENDAVIGGILPHILEQPSNPPLALLDRQLSSGVGFGGE